MRPTTLTLRLLLVVYLPIFLVGCDSFLEPDPASFSSGAGFYETPGNFDKAINGTYAQLRDVVGDDGYRNMTDLRGSSTTVHFDVNLPETVAGIPQLNKWKMTVSNPQVEEVWTDIYDLVKETNVILGRITDVEFADAAHKERIIGEAKFLRAFGYWLAVQFWGGVPLILEEVSSPGEALPEEGRASAEAVYQQIIADLQEAIGKLPVSYSGGDVGRITRGAAKMLLGRTYLLTGDYAKALAEFEALDQPPYQYQLLSNLRDIFNPANKNNVETIFSIQINPAIAGQPDLDLIQTIIPFNSGNELVPAPIVANGNFMPAPNVVSSFEGGDREEASIAWYVKEGNSQYVEIAFGDSLPYLYKFYWPDHIDAQGDMDMNWVVFRFADALLSAAEAAWRLGNTAKAVGYVNRVRARAGLPDVDLAEYSGQWTGSPLGDAILHERMLELLGEGHSWLDLKRFGDDVALKVMKAHSAFMRARDPKVRDEYDIQAYKLLYPIPSRAINLANLKQNPGWN